MKILLIILAIIATFFTGWYSHSFFTYDYQDGIQWKFTDAAQRNDVRQLEEFYRMGAQIKTVPTAKGGIYSGISALSGAAHYGQSDAIKWLLAHDADPSQIDIDMTPLQLAEWRLKKTQESIALLRSANTAEQGAAANP